MAQGTLELRALSPKTQPAAATAEGVHVVEEEIIQRGPVDVVLLGVVMLLISIGMVAIYSGSALGSFYNSVNGDDLIYLKRQASGAAVGFIALLVGTRLDYSFYRRHIYWFLAAAFFALTLTAVLDSRRPLTAPRAGFPSAACASSLQSS